MQSTNPWNPWLGIAVTLTRTTEPGVVVNPEEALTREEALRLYTVNNAWITFEEKEKGSLEKGKLADLIVLDRDILTCPLEDVRTIRVEQTYLGGKLVYERH